MSPLMQCVRTAANQMQIQSADGRVLANLSLVSANAAEFDDLTIRLAELLEAGPAPRVAVRYREGLLDDIQADIACEVVLIDEDRFDDPPICTRKRPIIRGDSAAVDAALAKAGQG